MLAVLVTYLNMQLETQAEMQSSQLHLKSRKEFKWSVAIFEPLCWLQCLYIRDIF